MKKAFSVILILVLILLLVVGGYVAYLFIDYHRLEDELALEINQRSETLLPVGEEQSIVSWNVGFGAYTADFSFFMDGGTESRAASAQVSEDNINGAIERLHAIDPDLMLIQEADVDGTRSRHVDQVEMIVSAFPQHSAVYAQNYDSGYLFYPITEPIGASEGGIISLSDGMIDSALRRSLPIESGIRKFFDLDRCYSVSRIPAENGRCLALYNLHLSAYTADGSIATEQLELMLQDMQAAYDAGDYVIAGGDFNKDLWGDSTAITGISGAEYSWAQAFPTELLSANFSLVDSLNREKPVLSCRDTGAPYRKGESFEVTLDGFIASDNVQVIACEVLDEQFRVSDHNPVYMRFVLME